MRLEEMTQVLKKERSRLSELRVKSLALFGSAARNEDGPKSALDFLVEFKGPATFDQYMGLKILLEDLFRCPVDLVTRRGIRPELTRSINKEAIDVA